MGVRFQLESAEAVAYLISRTAPPPPLTDDALRSFLDTLVHGAEWNLLSSDPSWPQYVAEAADYALRQLGPRPHDRYAAQNITLPGRQVEDLLYRLRRAFDGYALILLPLAEYPHRNEVVRFAEWAATLPGRGILSLIPDTSAAEAVTVLDPGPGVREALKRRDEWPGVIFTLRTERRGHGPDPGGPVGRDASRYVPLSNAYGAVEELSPMLEASPYDFDAEEATRILDGHADDGHRSARCRILHLSDLHFGQARAAGTTAYLQSAIKREIDRIDQIVISGDLFDSPKAPKLQDFKKFVADLQLLGGSAPIVVPGNHDQRVLGNAWWRFGRRYDQLSQVEWQHVVVDAEQKTVFLCFDSARVGDAARGEVSVEQLLDVAAAYDVQNSSGKYDGFLRVAVVHHHPYPYDTVHERSIVDPRSWPGRESLVEMAERERFLSWCAGRGVSLILHGHKHRPRLINETLQVDDEWHGITTVGCGTSTGANDNPLSFNLIEWSSSARAWSVDFRIDRGDGQGFRSAAVQSLVQTTSA